MLEISTQNEQHLVGFRSIANPGMSYMNFGELGSANAGSSFAARANNPLLGAVHDVETTPSSSASALQYNGRYQNIDETDEHLGGSPGGEARALELHERCNGYLMSRKLEALSQKIVAMGFSHDGAPMALILNDGKVEEYVVWLFEGGEEGVKHKESTGGILKIDISEELAQIVDMKIRNHVLHQNPKKRDPSTSSFTKVEVTDASPALSSNQLHFRSSSGPGDSPRTSRGNGLWSRTGASPMLAAASSLGLFTGLGSTTSSGAASPVDRSSGSSIAQLDYTNIDWSLERGLSSSLRPGEIWLGPSTSLMKSIHMYYPNTNGLSAKPAMRLTLNGKGVPIAGLTVSIVTMAEISAAGSH
ncbi:hypothetical protein F3Y22_tig00002237pilonHSYRG01983 [Hibiscus syriacus]|uniref:Uncharacterized protein n=1 Tax=Hibiscus syriacus TaxID=106335 RepID=A0A6A3CSW8_HIBSY|nr:hypothetical protein F3Y22_tig00002237pilonHSYRG01983 [Hibiscus syriacus]